ncbi:hypothetical protein DUNSADRAFT_2287 [Dunaliella salina]|uniref:EGF-like domain-containing protein n=1 Tax=Dunaliella salina TaxID=3046 RepID=A0ABQ7GVV3_DUNSA|nr:hypothetical protein DUNSADRAFT_2287 [Dunaliella salina]|eukprot:KAF5838743.1 hypothetical protein DUNSADRAFT_2287 [Dunaliella salina]
MPWGDVQRHDSSTDGLPTGRCIAAQQSWLKSSCRCSPGWGGFACASPVHNISAAAAATPQGAHIPLDIPPRSWAYFMLQVPDGPNPSMLIELQQPPGAGDAWDPILVVAPAATQVLNEWVDMPVPSLQVSRAFCCKLCS